MGIVRVSAEGLVTLAKMAKDTGKVDHFIAILEQWVEAFTKHAEGLEKDNLRLQECEKDNLRLQECEKDLEEIKRFLRNKGCKGEILENIESHWRGHEE